MSHPATTCAGRGTDMRKRSRRRMRKKRWSSMSGAQSKDNGGTACWGEEALRINRRSRFEQAICCARAAGYNRTLTQSAAVRTAPQDTLPHPPLSRDWPSAPCLLTQGATLLPPRTPSDPPALAPSQIPSVSS
ncbi:hypothetical protein SKAU_G00252840 [Synaphobranchus kaupii]|uniref:Uncharacterized protein n=1 Tax=Synaphobranchus kaupii TaxID=118154 RepID=A0A9Q1F366_SYNKA|nr:hypothetical protein SKAU_G00252840 [Synaphobranchus kaupii]